MWQRFTDRARRVVFFSQEEATQLGQSEVGPEHLLLAVLRDSDAMAAQVLSALQIDVGNLRNDVLNRVERATPGKGEDMTLTQQGNRAIDIAYFESRNLCNHHVGTEHLLLGLIRNEPHSTCYLLAKHGASTERVRDAVIQVQARFAYPDGEDRPERPLCHLPFRDLYRVFFAEPDPARTRGATTVEPVHLLIAVLAPGTEAAQLLTQVGIQVSRIRDSLLGGLPAGGYSIHPTSQFGATARKLLDRAFFEFFYACGPEPDSRNLLRALLDEEAINAILSREGINLEELRQRLWSLPHDGDPAGGP